MYLQPWCLKKTHCVHARHEGEVGRCIVPGRKQEAATLSSRQINHLGLGWLCIDSIDFNNRHVVALKPYILACKGTNVDHPEHVSPARLDLNAEVLRLVEQCILGDRFSASRIVLADETLEQVWHLVVVPVRHGQDLRV